jgi:hypothetical protein
MVNKIPLRVAINAVLSILVIVIIFHLLVLTGIVPSNIVWGGRFQNETQLRNFEVVSVIINAFVILVVATKGQYLNLHVPMKIINIILWLLVLIFAFNTIANLFAKTTTEVIIFTPTTFILALLCFRIAKG